MKKKSKCKCVAYKPANDSSGAGSTGPFLDTVVQEFDLDINDCRGHGYDNGAKMVGVNKAVQTRILIHVAATT